MNITITFRHMQGTEAVRSYAHEKTAKLQRYLRHPMTAQVTLSIEGLEHVAEVGISAGSAHIHAAERCADMYEAIDKVHDKLERQIKETKDVVVTRKRGGTPARDFAASAERAALAAGRTKS